MLSGAAKYRVFFGTLIGAGILYVATRSTSNLFERRNIALDIVICMFLALLGVVSMWAAWSRPVSILWKLPLLFLSIGAGIGLGVWVLCRRADPPLAQGALIMQILGTPLAVLMMIGGHAS